MQVPADSISKALPKKKKKKVPTPGTIQAREPDTAPYASDSDSAVSDRSNISDRPRNYNTRAAGLLLKQPSIVREDREGEEIAESSVTNKVNGNIIGNLNAASNIGRAPAKILANGQPQGQNWARNQQQSHLAKPRPWTFPELHHQQMALPQVILGMGPSDSHSAQVEQLTSRRSQFTKRLRQ